MGTLRGSASMMNKIPAEVTAAELAKALGISERRVATLKAEGRIPTSPGGPIRLHEYLRQVHRAEKKTRIRKPRVGST